MPEVAGTEASADLLCVVGGQSPADLGGGGFPEFILRRRQSGWESRLGGQEQARCLLARGDLAGEDGEIVEGHELREEFWHVRDDVFVER